MDRTKSEMESGLSWLFAEAFIWKCERELLSAEERSRGKKLALGLTDEMQDFQDEAVLCVAPRSGRSFQANGYSVVCPRILTMDLENRIDWCGATIQLQHVWTRSDSGFVLLSDPSVAEATRVEAKQKLLRRARHGEISVALRRFAIQDPTKLVLEWIATEGKA